MENFIKRLFFILINLIPNKELRHKLRDYYNKNCSTYYFVIDPSIIKKEVFLKNKDKYNTVVLGSSHCEYAFNPEFFDVPAFNFGLNSADNITMYYIYKELIKKSDIKNIVVMYDVFSKGSNNSARSDFRNGFLHQKYILGVNYEQSDKRIEKFCKKHAKKLLKSIDYEYSGYKKSDTDTLPTSNKDERCAIHLKLHNKPSKEIWIEKLAKECNEDSKHLVLLLSPAQPCYKNKMPPMCDLFNDIITRMLSMSGLRGRVIDFYSTDFFNNESYWIDMDHLNNK